jgi:vacuolar protein sorting-associated protein 54
MADTLTTLLSVQVSAERQAALTRLCEGRSVWSTASNILGVGSGSLAEASSGPSVVKKDAEVEGVRYKVVWSCLLLVEMVMTNMACAAHFQALATNVVGKVAELLRLFNSRSTQLVLGAGAIHSAARLKSINAKHLSLVTQCLGMIIAILPHVRASLMAQLPAKQHTLLNDLDKIKKEYVEHNEKVLNKFVTIIGGIVEHGLASRINSIDFDERAKSTLPDGGTVQCCAFLDGVSTNTKKMHQVLSALLPPDHLQDVFSRIFAFVDQKIPELFISAATSVTAQGQGPSFSFPTTEKGKRQMLLEVETMTKNLNGLAGVRPWEFTAVAVLERKLEYRLHASVAFVDVQSSVAAKSANPAMNGVDDDKKNEPGPSAATEADEGLVAMHLEPIDNNGDHKDATLANGESPKLDSTTSDSPLKMDAEPAKENGQPHQAAVDEEERSGGADGAA